MTEQYNASELIKSRGLRVTHARTQILSLLIRAHEAEHTHHLSAEQVSESLEQSGEHTIPLNTIYRVLTQFEQCGLVDRHYFEGGVAYHELRPSEHHDHMICTECNKVIEFVDEDIERLQEEVAAKYGFYIVSHALHLYGRCAECQEIDPEIDQEIDSE